MGGVEQLWGRCPFALGAVLGYRGVGKAFWGGVGPLLGSTQHHFGGPGPDFGEPPPPPKRSGGDLPRGCHGCAARPDDARRRERRHFRCAELQSAGGGSGTGLRAGTGGGGSSGTGGGVDAPPGPRGF